MRIRTLLSLSIVSSFSMLGAEAASAAQLHKQYYDFSVLETPLTPFRSVGLSSALGQVGEKAGPSTFPREPGILGLNEKGEYVGRRISTTGANPQNQLFAFSSTSENFNLGPSTSQALGINDNNVVVGQRYPRGGFQTTRDGTIENASDIAGTILTFDVNNKGVSVGLSRGRRPYRANFDGNFSRELTAEGGIAYDINEFDQVVGRSGGRAFFCDGTLDCTPKDLGTLRGEVGTLRDNDRGTARAFALNDFPDVNLVEFVGDASAKGTDKTHAAYGRVTGAIAGFTDDLGTLCTNDANCNSVARDINRNISGRGGKIVGSSDTDTGEEHAFVVFGRSKNFTMVDLNDRIMTNDIDFYSPFRGRAAFTLNEATAINDAGVIVGNATANFSWPINFERRDSEISLEDHIYGFRLTPVENVQSVPEPASAGLGSMAVLALGAAFGKLKRQQN